MGGEEDLSYDDLKTGPLRLPFSYGRSRRSTRRRRPRSKYGLNPYGLRGVVPSGSYAPKRLYMKFKYTSDWVTFDGTAVTEQRYISGNSLFSPDPGWSADHPPGFYQWGDLYATYKVISSKIIIWAHNGEVDPTPVCSVVVYPSTTSGGIGTTSRPEATPGSKMKVVGKGFSKNECITLTHYASTDSVLGSALRDTSDLSASWGSNPNMEWIWIVNFCSSHSAQNLVVSNKIQVIYSCIIYDPKNIAVS